jgi:hypothetical protein
MNVLFLHQCKKDFDFDIFIATAGVGNNNIT